MNLNPSTMRLGIASILVGLVGAYGVRNLMEEEEAPVVAEAPEKVSVPIASADLPPGRNIRRGDIAFRSMTLDDMNAEGMQPSAVMMDESFIMNRETRRPIRAGQPFLTTDVYLDGDSPGYDVTPGMRTAQVRVAEDRGGSQVEAGDLVDLFFTSTAAAPKDGRPSIPEKTIHLVDAAKILNVQMPRMSEQRWTMGYKGKSPIFTLEVEPETAGKIYALQAHGDFSMMLRAPGDPKGRNSAAGEYDLLGLLGIEEPVAPEPPPIWQTEYIKGTGGKFAKSFPIPQPRVPVASDQFAQRPAPKPEEVLPVAPKPTPARPSSRPQIPYRPDATPTPSVLPPAPSAPASDPVPPPAAGSSTSNPFSDDGDVLP